MSYLLDIHKEVEDNLEGLPSKHRAQIWGKISHLRHNPRPADYAHISGYPPFLRVDSGEYRIIYAVTGNVVKVVVVGQRNDDDAYKLFKRRYQGLKLVA